VGALFIFVYNKQMVNTKISIMRLISVLWSNKLPNIKWAVNDWMTWIQELLMTEWHGFKHKELMSWLECLSSYNTLAYYMILM
jgi:hypothetical protein